MDVGALLVGVLDREHSVEDKELDDGHDPGVLLGDRPVLDEREHLVKRPSPSGLGPLEVEPDSR